MSDDFTICNKCGVENELVDIQLMHGRLGKEAREKVESYFFCLSCGKTQLKSETEHRHVDYKGSDSQIDREEFSNAVKEDLHKEE